MIAYDDFAKVDIRVGRIINIEDFPRARNPSYKLTIDFGAEIGIKCSSAQITFYDKEALKGRLIAAVVNFAPRNIAGFMSEVLVLGTNGVDGMVRLLNIDEAIELGEKIH